MASTDFKPTVKPIRRVKLQETTNLYQLKHGQSKSTPSLLLKGQWLVAAGFSADQIASIQIEHGRLVIVSEGGKQ